jgi:Sulfotransferase family
VPSAHRAQNYSANLIVPTAMTASADVLYIGYPKAASVFIGKFLENHPEVMLEHHRIALLLLPRSTPDLFPSAGKPHRGKIHVSRHEGFAESLCVTGDLENWHRYKYVPGAWDRVKNDILVDPGEAASRLYKAHPDGKVLMVIREQVDWLNSIYKYSINELPAAQRSFADYCATPYGSVLLQAGYFDRTIRAYVDTFGSTRVCVLRYEDIVEAPERFVARLCAFIGISERPLPQRRENESHALIARLLRLFPSIGRLPRKAKDAIKPRVARLLPGARGVLLSSRDIRMLRSIYAVSNQHTEKLISQLCVTAR